MSETVQVWQSAKMSRFIEDHQISGVVKVVFTEQDLAEKPIRHPDILIANVVGLGNLIVDEATKEVAATVLVVGENTQNPLSVNDFVNQLALYPADKPLAVTVKRDQGIGALMITDVQLGVDANDQPVLYCVTYSAARQKFLDNDGRLQEHYMDS